jgi:hypothetical protein
MYNIYYMISNQQYREKYLKYKIKYNELKKRQNFMVGGGETEAT